MNVAFDTGDAKDFRLLCPYDTAALDPAVVAHARGTHPLVQDAQGRVHTSTAFHGLEAAAAPCTAPLPLPPVGAQTIPIMPAGCGRCARRSPAAPRVRR